MVIRNSLSAYSRLGTFSFTQHYWFAPISWSLLPKSAALQPRSIALLCLVLVIIATLRGAAKALDDVQGMRDGIDVANLERLAQLQQVDPGRRGVPGAYDKRRKPIVTGEISEKHALAFAAALCVIGAGAGLALFLIAPHWSPSLLVFGAILLLATVQYSFGLKFSYHGVGEFLIAATSAASIAIPFVLIRGELTAEAGLVSAVVALWFVQISHSGNMADRDVDRRGRRFTVAARLAPSRGRAIAVAFAAMEALVLVVGLALDVLSAWLVPALIPTAVTRGFQLRAGVLEGQWLRARQYGLKAFTWGAIAILVTHVLERYLS